MQFSDLLVIAIAINTAIQGLLKIVIGIDTAIQQSVENRNWN